MPATSARGTIALWILDFPRGVRDEIPRFVGPQHRDHRDAERRRRAREVRRDDRRQDGMHAPGDQRHDRKRRQRRTTFAAVRTAVTMLPLRTPT